MSWKDSLLPASFRGVEFKVSDIDIVHGRRIHLHEYPSRDDPYAEDLGRKAREYTVNAYIIGDDYLAQRDALVDAVENNSTPGTLIHPTMGALLVVPKECRIIYNNQEGNLERFVLVFVEAGFNDFPLALIDTIFQSVLGANNAISSILSDFSTRFNVSNAPDFLTTSALSNSSSLISMLSSALNIGTPNTTNASNYINTLNTFSNNSSSLLSSYASDITNPAVASTDTWPGQMTGLISGLTAVYDNPIDAYNAQKSLQNYLSTPPLTYTTTPERIQQAGNQTAMINLVRNTSIAEMIKTTSQMTFASRNDAIAIRDEVSDLLEPQLTALADAGNDTQYLAFQSARAAMVNDINTRGAQLPNITNINTFDSVPALVFAYKLYEDASRDQEIVDRNKIVNPGFLPAFTPIEILTA